MTEHVGQHHSPGCGVHPTLPMGSTSTNHDDDRGVNVFCAPLLPDSNAAGSAFGLGRVYYGRCVFARR